MNTLKLDPKDLMEVFDSVSMRNYQSIKRRWIESEKEKLKSLRRLNVPSSEMAKILGRSHKAVSSCIFSLGLSEPRPKDWEWTQKEIGILIANAGKKSLCDIAKILRRDQSSIDHQACRQGISLAFYRRHWTRDMDIRVKQGYIRGEKISSIAKAVGRSYDATKTHASAKGWTSLRP